jgi:chromosome segregation ATPase
MALDKNDLKAIGSLMDKKFDDFAIVIGKSFGKLTNDINQRFDAVDKRFEQVDNRFESIEKRLNKIELDIGSVRADIRRIQNDIDDIKEQLDRIEKKTSEDDDAISCDVVDLRTRVEFLEKEVKRLKLQKTS